MPALLVATDTNTTETMSNGIRDTIAGPPEPIAVRVRRNPLAVVVGLALLSTVLLVALAVVALTDHGDAETTEDAARPARSFHRAHSICRSGRRRITSGGLGSTVRSRCRTGVPVAAQSSTHRG